MVKEEWPREGSTSWSFACVKSDGWLERERERKNGSLMSRLQEGDCYKIMFVYH